MCTPPTPAEIDIITRFHRAVAAEKRRSERKRRIAWIVDLLLVVTILWLAWHYVRP